MMRISSPVPNNFYIYISKDGYIRGYLLIIYYIYDILTHVVLSLVK